MWAYLDLSGYCFLLVSIGVILTVSGVEEVILEWWLIYLDVLACSEKKKKEKKKELRETLQTSNSVVYLTPSLKKKKANKQKLCFFFLVSRL